MQKIYFMELNIRVENKLDFYGKILDILSALSKRPLTQKEKEILSIVMASNSKNPFYGTSRKLIKQQLNMKEQTFAMNKSNIEEKGWVIQGELNPFLKQIKDNMITDSIGIKIKINMDEK